jgi:hydroxyethylthiazole kinase-like uncharacterized protein yjeF
MRFLSRESMREVDRIAIEDFLIPGVILMENAGRGATDVACGMLGADAGKTVVIVCGKGNNGGDGFVVARHLANRGHHPRIWFLGELEGIPEGTDAQVNAAICARMELPARNMLGEVDIAAFRKELTEADLVVDAIFGTGLSGPVRGLAGRVIDVINASARPVLAIDIPSGIDSNTGEVLGTAVRARETATFAAAKYGLVEGDGPAHAGQVTVIEISIPRQILERT